MTIFDVEFVVSPLQHYHTQLFWSFPKAEADLELPKAPSPQDFSFLQALGRVMDCTLQPFGVLLKYQLVWCDLWFAVVDSNVVIFIITTSSYLFAGNSCIVWTSHAPAAIELIIWFISFFGLSFLRFHFAHEWFLEPITVKSFPSIWMFRDVWGFLSAQIMCPQGNITQEYTVAIIIGSISNRTNIVGKNVLVQFQVVMNVKGYIYIYHVLLHNHISNGFPKIRDARGNTCRNVP